MTKWVGMEEERFQLVHPKVEAIFVSKLSKSSKKLWVTYIHTAANSAHR